MAVTGKYVPSAREQAFLDTIESPKYDRGIINGLRPFFQDKAPEDIKSFYSPDELSVLSDLHGTERDVEARMPVKMTRHFFEMAQNSQRMSWTREEVDKHLHNIMINIHEACRTTAEEYGQPGNNVLGANISGFRKIADTMMDQGVV